MSNRNLRLDQCSLPTDRVARLVEVPGNVEADADEPNASERAEILAPRSVGEASTERFIWLLHTR
ncbi:MAG: hypothetical protein ABI899_00825 [Actinomycetota bacterium]